MNTQYNEIKRLQQLAGIITEIKINKPNIGKLNVEILYKNPDENDEDNEIGIEYSDIGVGGFFYPNDAYITTLFNIDLEEDDDEGYSKLIDLLKTNNIRDYNIPENGEYNKIVEVPIKYINFINPEELEEIKINTPGFNFSKGIIQATYIGEDNDYLENNTYVQMSDLGPYFTFIPYSGMELESLKLFPREDFDNIEYLDRDLHEDEINAIKLSMKLGLEYIK